MALGAIREFVDADDVQALVLARCRAFALEFVTASLIRKRSVVRIQVRPPVICRVLSAWRPVVAEMPPVRPFGSGRTHCWSANDDAWSRKRGKLSLTLLSQLASQPPPSCNLFVSACCRHENDTFAGRRWHFCQGPAARGAAADLLRRAGHGGLTGSPDSEAPVRRIAIV